MPISPIVFEAYLKCPTKCFLRSRGEAGLETLAGYGVKMSCIGRAKWAFHLPGSTCEGGSWESIHTSCLWRGFRMARLFSRQERMHQSLHDSALSGWLSVGKRRTGISSKALAHRAWPAHCVSLVVIDSRKFPGLETHRRLLGNGPRNASHFCFVPSKARL